MNSEACPYFRTFGFEIQPLLDTMEELVCTVIPWSKADTEAYNKQWLDDNQHFEKLNALQELLCNSWDEAQRRLV